MVLGDIQRSLRRTYEDERTCLEDVGPIELADGFGAEGVYNCPLYGLPDVVRGKAQIIVGGCHGGRLERTAPNEAEGHCWCDDLHKIHAHEQ